MPNIYLPGVIQIPSALTITAISQTSPMQITFTVPSTGANTYIPGQSVKLNVPQSYGMFQANGLVGQILSVSLTSMILNINSSGFDPFVVPAASAEQPATLVPSGSRNLQYDNTTGQVPFQSLNNIGN